MSKERWQTVEEAPEPWHRRRSTRYVAAGLALAALAAFLLMPERRPRPVQETSAAGPSASEDLFRNSASLLNRLEQIHTPDVMAQIVGGFRQWLEEQGGGEGWQPDPMLAKLPDKYADFFPIEYLALSQMSAQEGESLEEAVAMRDVARMARGQQIDDLTRATNLFDWTVRNLQLDPPHTDPKQWRTVHPRRILIQGHAEAAQRAWIFILLARQEHLDVVMLAVKDPQAPGGLRNWAPALLSDGQLYVFDTMLGMPIPGPNGEGVATLAQLAAADALLRRLDLDDVRYPLTAADLAEVTAFVEARPVAVSRHMQLIEAALTGDQKLVLTVAPSRIAEALKACPQVAKTSVWPFPLDEEATGARIFLDPAPEIVAAMGAWNLPFQLQPELEMGRKYHFKGNLTGENDEPGEPSANLFYQGCRIKPDAIEERAARQAAEIVRNESIPPEQRDRRRKEIEGNIRDALQRAMQNATYWLGIIAYERGRYDTAIDYFKVRILEEAPGSQFVPGARYNLGRCYEAQGNWELAAATYEADDSAQSFGNKLRARWLRDRAASATTAAE